MILARNLLGTLRGREIDAAAKTIAAETGLTYRTVADSESVTGTYRRSVQLACGRFAMLDDDMAFSLVPWKPVIEQTGAGHDSSGSRRRRVVGIWVTARAVYRLKTSTPIPVPSLRAKTN